MNETPASLSSALGRINKYDVEPGVESGGAIFIRDTFHEQNGAHVRTDIVEIMVQIYPRAYKFRNISVL